jgi:hypothetical protein
MQGTRSNVVKRVRVVGRVQQQVMADKERDYLLELSHIYGPQLDNLLNGLMTTMKKDPTAKERQNKLDIVLTAAFYGSGVANELSESLGTQEILNHMMGLNAAIGPQDLFLIHVGWMLHKHFGDDVVNRIPIIEGQHAKGTAITRVQTKEVGRPRGRKALRPADKKTS